MAINVTLGQQSTLSNTSILSQANANSEIIQSALTDALSRSGVSPNQMGSNLDMNGNQILNLPSPATVNSPARLVDVVSNPTITVPPTGTSGATVPLLNSSVTFSGQGTTMTALGTAAIFATAYGVTANGTTDDTTAMQNAINACAALNTNSNSTGATLFLPAGNILLSNTLTSTNAIRIVGAGAGGGFSPTSDTGGTIFLQSSLSSDTFLFTTTNGVVLRDFAIVYGTGSSGTGNAIHIRPAVTPASNPNRNTRIDGVRVWGGGVGIYMDSCANFSITNCHIMNFSNLGIYLPHNSSDPDEGDGIISGNVIWDFSVNSGNACIRLDPAAAVQIIGNKLLSAAAGIWLTVSQGPTGTLLISGNSIEQYTSIGVWVEQTTSGKTYGFIDIHDNEFECQQTNAQAAITVSQGSAAYISQMNIHDNIIVQSSSNFSAPAAINIADGTQVNIHDNNINQSSMTNSIGVSVSGNATVVQVYNNQIENATNKYVFSVPATLLDLSGIAGASLPTSNVNNGSQMYCTNCTSPSGPCSTGGTGSMAFRLNGAWKCI